MTDILINCPSYSASTGGLTNNHIPYDSSDLIISPILSQLNATYPSGYGLFINSVANSPTSISQIKFSAVSGTVFKTGVTVTTTSTWVIINPSVFNGATATANSGVTVTPVNTQLNVSVIAKMDKSTSIMPNKYILNVTRNYSADFCINIDLTTGTFIQTNLNEYSHLYVL